MGRFFDTEKLHYGRRKCGRMSWDDKNRLKFIGKTNRLKISVIFTILDNFVCFFNFPDRNLIILYKIT